jgi:pyrroloquinoline quinone biosynthesis protein D
VSVPGDSILGPTDVPSVARLFRLQYEQAQQAWVLLYPEGMVKLSGSAGEIMQRIDGVRSVDTVIRELESSFPGADVRRDVVEFLEVAHGRGWITTQR